MKNYDPDLYMDLHNLYWDHIFPRIKDDKVDDKVEDKVEDNYTITNEVIDELNIEPFINEDGTLVIYAMDFDTTITTDRTLIGMVEQDIKNGTCLDGTLDQGVSEMLLKWKKTLSDCIHLIDLAFGDD